MTTLAEIMEAERLSRQQRRVNARRLEIDEAQLTPKELESCRRILAYANSATEFEKFEAALQHPAVGQLFNRGALFFRRDV